MGGRELVLLAQFFDRTRWMEMGKRITVPECLACVM